jgi:hypothetical protein
MENSKGGLFDYLKNKWKDIPVRTKIGVLGVFDEEFDFYFCRNKLVEKPWVITLLSEELLLWELFNGKVTQLF